MTENINAPPDGYHYRGMVPTSPNSKLCTYISEENACLDWKNRYFYLWTYDKSNDVKDINGKVVPLIRCTVCDKKIKMSFQSNG